MTPAPKQPSAAEVLAWAETFTGTRTTQTRPEAWAVVVRALRVLAACEKLLADHAECCIERCDAKRPDSMECEFADRVRATLTGGEDGR